MRIKGVDVSDSQAEVYSALKRFGPIIDGDLISITRHVLRSKQSHSGIRTRRLELQRKGLVENTGNTELTASGRKAVLFDAR